MKKLTYLLLVMFATVLMNTSCEKDETVTPEIPIITLEEFAGYWNFVQCEYNSVIYSSCQDIEDDSNADSRLRAVEFDVELIPSTAIVDYNNRMYWDNICFDGNIYPLPCTLNEKQNKFSYSEGMIFKILEYNKSTKTLKVELSEGSEYVLVGVIYTWRK
ncbi:MAG: hypothetical protein PF487_10575 [Bacteroidales bacterium]|jgi:hypothetical protein|nr:hypothetical protein [Bacteroidales bacterium]